MNWEALGAIGEIVGAAGVVVTLGYLAIQIRQNTQSVRAAAFQEAIRDAAQSTDQLGRDPELTRIWFAGQRDFEALTGEERQRFAVYSTSVFRRYENIIYQAHHSALDPESWEGIRQQLRYALSQPGTVAWWKRGQNLFNRQLREFVEQELQTKESTPAAFYEGAPVKPSSSNDAGGG